MGQVTTVCQQYFLIFIFFIFIKKARSRSGLQALFYQENGLI